MQKLESFIDMEKYKPLVLRPLHEMMVLNAVDLQQVDVC